MRARRDHRRMELCRLLLLVGLTGRATGESFPLGVSAGDVTDTSAILWTRAARPGAVTLEVGTRADFREARSFQVVAEPASDLTIQVPVEGLAPGTEYFYRFRAADDPQDRSRIGRFRTAPAPEAEVGVRLVFSGDTNFAWAPFAVLGDLAREPADFFIWFGDTIYADVAAGGLGRAQSLEEYRAKYRQLRSDPHVQEAAAAMGVWVGWDDHEVFNDYAGRDPHVPSEQLSAAYQAFFEYMPLRPSPVEEHRTYRSFRYGALAEFFLLDARQYREPSVRQACGGNPDPLGLFLGSLTRDAGCAAHLSNPRAMLGRAQLDWLCQGLLASGARYKFVVNNVPLSLLGLVPYDRWDGYDAERRELLEFIDAHRIDGVVFLTTDLHASLVNPDVMRVLRERLGYALPNGVRAPEIVVGPLGNQPARGTAAQVAAGVLGLSNPQPVPLPSALLEAADRWVSGRLMHLNGLSLLEDNRVAYAVIEATADGRLMLELRGRQPERAQSAPGDSETFHIQELSAPAAPLPCFVPAVFAALGLAGARAGWRVGLRSVGAARGRPVGPGATR